MVVYPLTGMRLIRQLIGAYLALCLAAGGVVATNPFLHRLIEHGGQGAAHTHVGTGGHLHRHGDSGWHSHESPARPRAIFEHSYDSSDSLRVAFAILGQLAAQLLEGASESRPTPDEPGHQHHSLFEMLAAGMLEQPFDLPILPSVPAPCVRRDTAAESPFVSPGWNAQTASRAPPAARG